MSRRPQLRAAVGGALLGVFAMVGMLGPSGSTAPVEAAQATNRAAVVVNGDARCISFDAPSITGVQALQAAGFSPSVWASPGEGGAVCAINGTGCAADSSCLTCAAPNYWAYFRADAGAGGFTYSQVGAGSTQVTDGDVEGWRWGTGAAPGFVAFADVCPIEPPPTTTTRPPANPGGGNTGGGPSGGGPVGGVPGGQPGSPEGSPAGEQPGATSTTVSPTTTPAGERGEDRDGRGEGAGGPADGLEDVEGEEAAARAPLVDDGDGGGGLRTWVAFVALLGGFGLAGWRIRRMRSGSA